MLIVLDFNISTGQPRQYDGFDSYSRFEISTVGHPVHGKKLHKVRQQIYEKAASLLRKHKFIFTSIYVFLCESVLLLWIRTHRSNFLTVRQFP